MNRDGDELRPAYEGAKRLKGSTVKQGDEHTDTDISSASFDERPMYKKMKRDHCEEQRDEVKEGIGMDDLRQEVFNSSAAQVGLAKSLDQMRMKLLDMGDEFAKARKDDYDAIDKRFAEVHVKIYELYKEMLQMNGMMAEQIMQLKATPSQQGEG